MLSRLQVATYVANELAQGRPAAVQSAAAWLITGNRTREARYLARDVAKVLAGRGHLYVRIVTAKPLNAGAHEVIESYIKRETGATELEMETVVDATLIGGLVIELPGASLDASVRAKLHKFVEGIK